MARSFPSKNGDRCASDYERAIIDDLIDRGVEYGYESRIGEDKKFSIAYATPVTRGYCEACGESGKRVVQRRSYTPDIHLPSGIIVEVKGKFPPAKRNLMYHLIRCNPDIDIRFIFMIDNWMTKKRVKTYTQWALQKGFKGAVAGDPRQNPGTKAYGVGGIPEEWIYGE